MFRIGCHGISELMLESRMHLWPGKNVIRDEGECSSCACSTASQKHSGLFCQSFIGALGFWHVAIRDISEK